MRPSLIALAAGSLFTPTALAQFNPSQGQWLKDDPDHVRVMTWNIGDNLTASQTKTDGFNGWTAVVRIVAALEPDVLLLQEAADDNGADSVSQVQQTLLEFRNGNGDPNTGTLGITEIALTPGYDLPHAYILGNATDGFNRNIILSRFPITDLNGDGQAAADDFFIQGDQWAPGGDGGIRGFSWAEIDLPDQTYAGDLVVGNSHLKAFGDCNSYNQRQRAAMNISYFIQYYWNGNGGPATDPNNAINNPASGSVLDPDTPVVWGGDWNNTPTTQLDSCNGNPGVGQNPVEWITRGDLGSGNGPDRDGTDAMRDFAQVPGSGGDSSTQSASKLDYLAWQDSIATAANQFIFNAGSTSFPLPQPVASGPRPTLMSGIASDHRPVIVDFILPAQATTGPPVISNFSASPQNVAFTQTLNLSATVFDPDGSALGAVDFFEDSNNNAAYDPGTDQLVASVAPTNPGGTSTVSASVSPSAFLTQSQFDALIGGNKAFFAVASDGTGTTTESTTVGFVNLAPSIDSFTAVPTQLGIFEQTSVELMVSDADDTIDIVEIVFDTDDNNTLDPTDDVVASQTGVGQPVFTLQDGFAPGDFLPIPDFNARLGGGNRVFARVTDQKGDTNETTLSLTFENTPPQINASATPNPAQTGQDVTVTANVTDPDGTTDSVTFAIDDGDGVIEFNGDDIFNFVFAPPYENTFAGSSFNLGSNQILVEAFDNNGGSSLTGIVVEVTDQCDADFNDDGEATPSDVNAFLAAFASNSLAADVNNDGSLTPSDINAFIAVFQLGCP